MFLSRWCKEHRVNFTLGINCCHTQYSSWMYPPPPHHHRYRHHSPIMSFFDSSKFVEYQRCCCRAGSVEKVSTWQDSGWYYCPVPRSLFTDLKVHRRVTRKRCATIRGRWNVDGPLITGHRLRLRGHVISSGHWERSSGVSNCNRFHLAIVDSGSFPPLLINKSG